MTIGEKIKSARKKADLTQKALAQKTGLATGTIQQYEYGDYKPKIEQLRKIATALNVPVECLIDSIPIDFMTKNEIKAIEYFAKQIDTQLEQHENRLLQNYRQLNDDGQRKVSDYAKDLTKVPEYRREDKVVPMMSEEDPGYVNAAHADDYANAPEELKQQEEQIMDNKDF